MECPPPGIKNRSLAGDLKSICVNEWLPSFNEMVVMLVLLGSVFYDLAL